MNWISIINAIIPFAANGVHQKIQLSGNELDFFEAGLDSLDVAVIGVYLCELLDVPIEVQKEIPASKINDFINFMELNSRNKNITPELINSILK